MNSVPSLDDMIAEVARKGYRVHNLFQLSENVSRSGARWQANVTQAEKVWEFGQGDTPSEALAAALARAESENPRRLTAQGKVRAEVESVGKLAASLDDLGL